MQKFAFFPQFLAESICDNIIEKLNHFPIRTVNCENGKNTWSEQSFEFKEIESLIGLELLSISSAIIGKEIKDIVKVMAWLSIYSAFEYINPHMDKSGDIQFLVCLENVGSKKGGKFSLTIADNKINIPLKKGDVIIFSASNIIHATTQVLPTTKLNPRRITLACRLYF